MIPLCSACRFEMVIPADTAHIATITKGVDQMLREQGWQDEDISSVDLALMEALSNAIRHGCKSNQMERLQCCVTSDDSGEVMIVVRDPGQGFDRSSVPDPRAPENLHKSGGRGIFLINEVMDEVRFANGGSEVQMRKRRETKQRPPEAAQL